MCKGRRYYISGELVKVSGGDVGIVVDEGPRYPHMGPAQDFVDPVQYNVLVNGNVKMYDTWVLSLFESSQNEDTQI